jgi:hypothetical protein
VKTTTFYVTSAVAGAGIIFALLMGDSLGLFGGCSGAKPLVSMEWKNAGRASLEKPVGRTANKRSEQSVVGAVDLTSDPVIKASRLNEENLKLRTRNNELQNRLVAVLNWILANFKGKYPVSETSLSKLQSAPLTEDYTLHSEALNFLKVTPDEEQKMNDAFAYARQTLEDIEAIILTVTNPRPDKVILHIPSFPEDGKVLREDLYAALDATLGQDRFDRFLQVSETGLKQSFYQFGEASRTMVFELAYKSNSTAPQLKIKDGWVIELGSNSRQVTAVESYVTNLPPKYHSYLAWLPEYVGRYSAPKQP